MSKLRAITRNPGVVNRKSTTKMVCMAYSRFPSATGFESGSDISQIKFAGICT